MKKKKNPPLKINASFDAAMKILSRPYPRDTMTYEEAVAKLPEYEPWIKNTYIDLRDKSHPKNKWIVEEIIAAPATDYEYGQFMMHGRDPKMFGNIPYQIVVLFGIEPGNILPTFAHLIDFETHFRSIS